jgi:site-specific DNA recombinase
MTALGAEPLEAALTWVYWSPCACGRKHAAVYCRQSLDKDGSGLAVARQREACEAIAKARGWHVIAVYVDNDMSGYSAKVRRPGYETVMTLMRDRKVDAVIAWAVDRLTRKMSDLETIITTATEAGVIIMTASGDLDLSTDTGRMVARILGSVATGEVERKSTRQKLAAAQAAKAGKRWTGSQRPFGWSADDYTVPVEDEARAIAEGCRLILSGGSVSGVVRTWEGMGVRPAQGERWTRQSVRAILTNPAIAGLRRYRGEIVGRGGWGGIVPEETFTAVQSILSDPGRKVPRGVRSLLGGLAVCRCGNRVIHTHAQQGHGVYRCEHATRDRANGPHVSIKSDPIDEYVTNVIAETMTEPDAAALFAKDHSADLAKLRDESAAIRRNMEQAAGDMAVGILPRAAYLAALERATARLNQIDAMVTEASRESVVAELISSHDVRATWDGLDLSRKRAIIGALMQITLKPAGRGRRVSVWDVDEELVSIRWHGLDRLGG